MIRWTYSYLASIPAVFLDGLLYCLIACFVFAQAYFGGDEAAKYIAPATKFWMNGIIGMAASFFGALKMFRSTSYAEHQEKKEADAKAAVPSFTPEPGKDTPTP